MPIPYVYHLIKHTEAFQPSVCERGFSSDLRIDQSGNVIQTYSLVGKLYYL